MHTMTGLRLFILSLPFGRLNSLIERINENGGPIQPPSSWGFLPAFRA